MNLDISLAPDIIFYISSLPVTNTLLWSFVINIFLIFIAIKVGSSLSLIPGRLQNFVELLMEASYDFVKSVAGSDKKAKRIFPLVFTMFIFTALANLFPFIPGQSAVTLKTAGGVVPLFRAVMSDYGMVFMMTIVSVMTTQIVAIITHGPFGYLGKFFNFQSPLKFFLGIMDIVGEIAKILSLSFRLFGNIFAGEVLGAVILYLVPFIAPLPFSFLGILTAIVQAFVFSVLTLVFISMASEIEEDELVEQASI